MLKKRKAISLLVAFIFCLSFIAPSFIAPDVAKASSTYEVVSAPTVTPAKDGKTNDLGIVKVTIADVNVMAYSILCVSSPSDFRFPNNGDKRPTTDPTKCGFIPVVDSPAKAAGKLAVVATGGSGSGDALSVNAFADYILPDGSKVKGFPMRPNNTFDIVMADTVDKIQSGGSGEPDDRYFYIYFNGINMQNTTGDLSVDFLPPSGSGFSLGQNVIIGKSTSTGSTLTTCKKVQNITDKGGTIDVITIHELSANTLKSSKKVKLEILTKGFTWDKGKVGTAEGALASYGWNFDGKISAKYLTNDDFSKDDLVEFTLNSLVDTIDEAGKLSFVNLAIEVDEDKATVGDEVEVKVSGGDITTQTFVVAKYNDYEAKVVEGTTKTLVAGQNSQEIGEFYIEEGAAGSLVEKRMFKFNLPSGVEWDAKNLGDYEVVSSGSITLGERKLSGDNDETTKWEITNASENDAVKIKFKDMKVNIAPDFRGDLEIEVSGSAGVEGTVKVAEVKPAATIEVDKVENVILGKPNQKIGNITLVEGDVEGFMDDTKEKGKPDSTYKRPDNDNGNKLLLVLDTGYRFSKAPTVKVIEGDIDIDNEATLGGNDNVLEIEVKTESKKTASKIEISDIYIDAYRTAPEGAISIEFAKGVSAVNETRWDTRSPGKKVIANCVTAALGETVGNGQFIIGSNIYEMNGVKKVMDAAPYIKNGRTYVPVRFLGYVLGLTDDDIVWDESSQKVTFTKGDTTVELVIGSTTITVNGEAQVMDVAPEISNDRTMLPARYVAEGFGFNVGWDETTRTVLISK